MTGPAKPSNSGERIAELEAALVMVGNLANAKRWELDAAGEDASDEIRISVVAWKVLANANG